MMTGNVVLLFFFFVVNAGTTILLCTKTILWGYFLNISLITIMTFLLTYLIFSKNVDTFYDKDIGTKICLQVGIIVYVCFTALLLQLFWSKPNEVDLLIQGITITFLNFNRFKMVSSLILGLIIGITGGVLLLIFEFLLNADEDILKKITLFLSITEMLISIILTVVKFLIQQLEQIDTLLAVILLGGSFGIGGVLSSFFKNEKRKEKYWEKKVLV